MHEHISIDQRVMMGKPCIKGTRITVELVLRWLAGGNSIADVVAAYPQLTEADIRAALEFAADSMSAPRHEASE